MSTSELMQQWYEEVWHNANEKFIDEGMTNDVIVHGLDPEGTAIGIDKFKAFYKNFRESFPSVKVDIQHLHHNDEYATAYCIVSATNAKNKDASFGGLSVIRVSDGKIAEGWNNFDFLKMYQQLGHILVAQIEE